MSSVSNSLLKGVKEACEYASGRSKKNTRKHQIKVPEYVDVKNIRLHLHLTRAEFSRRFGFSPRTVENGNKVLEPQTVQPERI